MAITLLNPGSWLYTDRMNDIGSDEIIAELRKSLRTIQEQDPIIVVPVQEMPGKFAIISGNHRALIAERDDCAIPARIIENDEDIAAVGDDIVRAWADDSASGDDSRDQSPYQRLKSQVVQAALTLQRRKRWH